MMQYTVVGILADGGESWVDCIEAETAEQACKMALTGEGYDFDPIPGVIVACFKGAQADCLAEFASHPYPISTSEWKEDLC